nr:EAL domain-containing protein [Actinomycetota bacterium]
ICGFEALIRWQHPERGLLHPEKFIRFAEDSAQIVPIGSWVLATACRETAGLGTDAHTSVNVSARQLQHPTLLASVKDALRSSGLAPAQLILEITETATVTDLRDVVATLHQLQSLGVRVALDDFGTGYSPLTYLQQLPVDYLKVDRSFVRSMTTRREDAAIVRGVVEMAHALGMLAVAEGVEHPEQLALLRDMGCDLAQGYLWTPPVPVEQLGLTIAVPEPRSAPSPLRR